MPIITLSFEIPDDQAEDWIGRTLMITPLNDTEAVMFATELERIERQQRFYQQAFEILSAEAAKGGLADRVSLALSRLGNTADQGLKSIVTVRVLLRNSIPVFWGQEEKERLQ